MSSASGCPFCQELIKVLVVDAEGLSGDGIFYMKCLNCESEGPVASTALEAVRKWDAACRKDAAYHLAEWVLATCKYEDGSCIDGYVNSILGQGR